VEEAVTQKLPSDESAQPESQEQPTVLIERMLDENPLVGFSVYSDIQSKAVQSLGLDVLKCLETGITVLPGEDSNVQCDGQVLNRASGLFWLWILGAYEVVRTMDGARQCFSARVAGQLTDLKAKLKLLRIPFAKQELAGQKIPIGGEAAIAGIRHAPPDLLYQVNGEVISAWAMIEEFRMVLTGIRRSDVLADHRTAYGPKI
jgi:hypothetical protein